LNEPIKKLTASEPTTSVGYKRFLKAISESNELVNIILRTHLLCEYYLDQILIAKIPRGDCLIDDSRTTFSYKIQLLKSFNFLGSNQSYLLDSASGLNRVRNDCSHTLDYFISESDIDRIGRPQGTKYLSLKKDNSEELKKLLVGTLIILVSGLDGVSISCVDEISLQKK
jgi:hypothetical protein